MNTTKFSKVLADSGIIHQVTDTLIENYSATSPFLPSYDTSELWEFFSDELLAQLEALLEMNSSDHRFYDKLSEALGEAEGSNLRLIRNTGHRTHSNVLFDPKGYNSEALITKDFIEYVLELGELAPYAVKQLDVLLKKNHIDFNVEVPDLGEPAENELLDVVFAGLLRMARNKPSVFHREVSIAMREKNIDPTKYTRTTMLDVIKDAKIIPG